GAEKESVIGTRMIGLRAFAGYILYRKKKSKRRRRKEIRGKTKKRVGGKTETAGGKRRSVGGRRKTAGGKGETVGGKTEIPLPPPGAASFLTGVEHCCIIEPSIAIGWKEVLFCVRSSENRAADAGGGLW
ncbi:MAG: hypothetical protein IJF59_03020, partial [Clostridia bacterium]|nr:hypothetical protein [Clostridia bacterium]